MCRRPGTILAHAGITEGLAVDVIMGIDQIQALLWCSPFASLGSVSSPVKWNWHYPQGSMRIQGDCVEEGLVLVRGWPLVRRASGFVYICRHGRHSYGLISTFPLIAARLPRRIPAEQPSSTPLSRPPFPASRAAAPPAGPKLHGTQSRLHN